MSSHEISRRSMLRAAAVLGLSVPTLAACVTAGGNAGQQSQGGDKSSTNPFGVKADAPLEVVVFKGAYGDDYVIAAEGVYKKQFGGSVIDHKGIQKVGDTLRPRFVAGNPPDVVNNTGAGRLDIAALNQSQQLENLDKLLDAPSWDDPNVKVRDTLLPGVVEDGTYDGSFVRFNYAYTAWGLWYSKPLFEKNGWMWPQTWPEMLELCEDIKKTGIAPWTYQGKFPEYMTDPLLVMAVRGGGMDLLKSIDNLQPNAWRHESVKAAAEAIAELSGKGYLMQGSEALSHTEAQAAWCQGKAAIIPSGSWLEAEQKSVTPAGFDMVMGAVPSLSSNSKLKTNAIHAGSSEAYLVPSQGKNVQGGLEFLRMLFSRDAMKDFAKSVGTLPSVKGATEGLTMSPALSSVAEAVKKAGDDTINYRHRIWYPTLTKAVDDAVAELVTRRITPAEWVDRVQKAADDLAKDTSIKKYERK
ncbi:N-acetylglucosamine/diacetylchitobiose ABC transporter substrate-binding protein [Lentzea sp. BCCO 10_0061]|uniref:N-acetylglucosamine/diacetylchitobiose ABC transporter substrate-binding protein n=1 Tax=Lentzea sokolovensis TaxID=3095429 RepID=A0ABU4V903_9PSEU|nr:N-acetylglucosamine/diacetylchitobiose ABC transporter substrate-binding protein [Lentzea sp. BCCO 10_0061]MDX8147451.1 N-acetylglucosamine/diacetylchitobiose ABC transporter substrate-binding protein [Lentzea sp. BCCO 10_0061]